MKYLLFFLLFFQICFSENLKFYDLNGTEIDPTDKPRSINEFVNKNFPNVKFFYNPSGINYRSISIENGYILSIFYYGFSNRPLFVLGKNPDVNSIKKALSLYSYDNFLYSYNFSYEFRSVLSKNSFLIDDAYIHLGKPDSINETNELTTFSYYDGRLMLFFKNNKLFNFNFSKR